LIALLFREYELDQRGTVLGTMFAVATVGSLVITPLAMSYTRGKTARLALRPPLVAALGFTAVTLVFILTLSAMIF
jgi:hypothetical protein